ncbi:Dehydrin ERD14 [Forsythia ovata]|uniref:Dehydrin ERD14 n=1 Tax=Forsythia ovata TaxID=205694 RepID=A0ABD1NVV3_9LAMI
MAEEVKHYQQNVDEPCDQASTAVKVVGEGGVEASDRGLFDFMGKKEEEKKPEEDVIVTEFEQKVQVCEEEEKKHESILQKLHRTSSSSSSSEVVSVSLAAAVWGFEPYLWYGFDPL